MFERAKARRDQRALDRRPKHDDANIYTDQRVLEAALRDTARHAAQANDVRDIQPLIQVCGPVDYRAWARGWQRHIQRLGRPTTIVWPAELAPDEHALLFLTPFAGRVGAAAPQYPQINTEPLLARPKLSDVATAELVGLHMLLDWLNLRGAIATRLAPPIFERIGRGSRVVDRWSEDYHQTWPIPVADGVRIARAPTQPAGRERSRPHGR